MRIIICGSMTASKEMVIAEKELQALGHKVILPKFTHEYAAMGSFDKMYSESARNKTEYDLIKDYYQKIEQSDALLVINVQRKGIEGYIGGNAFLEMGFAFVLDKPIYLLHKIPHLGYQDEIKAIRPILLNGDLSKITK